MFLLPIRSEKNTLKIPNFTIGLIGLNLVIWIFTNRIVSSEYKELTRIHQNLITIESEYMYQAIKKYPDLLSTGDILEIHEIFLKKEIIPRNSQAYQEWLKCYNEFQQLSNNTFFQRWGFIPAHMNFLKLLISLFLHGSFFHVFGNMLYLWIVGCNMEDDWGWPRFLGFYFLSGFAAGLIHAAFDPTMTIPCIGASGAVAGVMGAFMIRHFKTKIRFAYFFILIIRPFWGTFKIWAGIVLPFWFLQELVFARIGLQTGTAHWAHVGGFVFGAVVATVTNYLRPKESEPIQTVIQNGTEVTSNWHSQEAILGPLTPIPEDLTDPVSAIERLKMIILDEPNNFPVRLCLARIALRNGHPRDAGSSYNQALDTIFELQDGKTALAIYREIKQHQLLEGLSESNLFQMAALLEKSGKYVDAVNVLRSCIKWYPQGSIRPKAVYRAYLILKNEIGNDKLANSALAFLRREYPDFSIQTG